tara:strand:+ start:107 stop:301 length:195 start_codon:yes stop_codon:yes gene_type:complete
MIEVLTAFCITAVACIATYFWGKAQTNVNVIADKLLDTLKNGGYIKTKLDKNGEMELIKLKDLN